MKQTPENFIRFIIYGVLAVLATFVLTGDFMQTQLLNAPKNNPIVKFLARDISDEGRQFGPRIFTLWNISHILYYGLGAFLFPDYVVQLWFLGVLWEVIEHFTNRMANPLDIMWNTIGIFIGLYLHRELKR